MTPPLQNALNEALAPIRAIAPEATFAICDNPYGDWEIVAFTNYGRIEMSGKTLDAAIGELMNELGDLVEEAKVKV